MSLNFNQKGFPLSRLNQISTMDESSSFYKCKKINFPNKWIVNNSNHEFNNYSHFPPNKSFRALTSCYKYLEKLRVNKRKQSNNDLLMMDNFKYNYEYDKMSISSIELNKRNHKIRVKGKFNFLKGKKNTIINKIIEKGRLKYSLSYATHVGQQKEDFIKNQENQRLRIKACKAVSCIERNISKNQAMRNIFKKIHLNINLPQISSAVNENINEEIVESPAEKSKELDKEETQYIQSLTNKTNDNLNEVKGYYIKKLHNENENKYLLRLKNLILRMK